MQKGGATNKNGKQPYEPNKGAVGNMSEFFKQPGFGSQMKDNVQKTSQIFQGQSVYQANKPVGGYIAKGDKYYLDGSYNESKTLSAIKEGRRLPK